MRVLWVCNIILPVIGRQLGLEASNKEGWISGMASILLERRQENGIALSVAFPVQRDSRRKGRKSPPPMDLPEGQEIGGMACYGFPEDLRHPEKYDESLEPIFEKILQKVRPHIVHCFGTEYPHTLAVCRVFREKGRLLVGVQGLCTLIAEAYFANLPEKAAASVTFRDWLRRDSLRQQQDKFRLRGCGEREILSLAGNAAGRTLWDRAYVEKWNPNIRYYTLNETLREEFYGYGWREGDCIPHSIFLSQGDYPLKGLHYMLSALPAILEKYPDTEVYVAGDDLTARGTLKQRLKISAYGKYLRQLIEQNGLKGRIHFLGRLNAGQMRERYLKSSLFLCPSALENSPNSLGEAMLLGMPCVCAAVGGIPSLFTGGEDGILYEGYGTEDGKNDGIIDRLSRAVLEMWEDPGKRHGYCRNAKAHAERTHNREKNYGRLLEIYEEIGRRE